MICLELMQIGDFQPTLQEPWGSIFGRAFRLSLSDYFATLKFAASPRSTDLPQWFFARTVTIKELTAFSPRTRFLMQSVIRENVNALRRHQGSILKTFSREGTKRSSRVSKDTVVPMKSELN